MDGLVFDGEEHMVGVVWAWEGQEFSVKFEMLFRSLTEAAERGFSKSLEFERQVQAIGWILFKNLLH